jgi:opacity protein-like surface antigen
MRKCSVGSIAIVACLVSVIGAAPAAAQSDRPVEVQGFVSFGRTQFQAKDSFEAIFGDSSGTVVGVGGQVTICKGFLKGLFVGVSYEQFEETGERVFVFNGEVFPLGIENTVRIAPLLVTFGYKFGPFGRITPYGGGGFGSYKLEETSEFATDDENVDESFTGYHILGGAEVRIWRFISAAGEVKWATVSDALTGGVAAEFDEDNLGGTTLAAKVLIGW